MIQKSLSNRKTIGLLAGLLLSGAALYAQNAGTAVAILATDPTALEGTSSGAFTLIRYGPTTSDLTVDVAISGTASNGVDYVTIPTTLTIPAGSLALDVLVQPIVDTARRGNKTVDLTIDTNSAYSVIYWYRKARVTIIDDTFNVPPPTVSITSPTNGSVFLGPTNITIEADASDSGSPITSVSFYANDDFLGKVTTSPYSLVWSNVHGGRYVLFARAVDGLGQSTLSAPVQITVSSQKPTVTITSPTNGMNFVAHENITLTAAATDPYSPVTNVAFYANGSKLGSVATAPYTLVWSNAPAGFFFLNASATDQAGEKAYSPPVFINVSRVLGASQPLSRAASTQ